MKRIILFAFSVFIAGSAFAQRGTDADTVFMNLKKKYEGVFYFNATIPPCTPDWYQWYFLMNDPTDSIHGIADSYGNVIVEPGQYVENAPNKTRRYQITREMISVKKNHGINGFVIVVGDQEAYLVDSTGRPLTTAVFFNKGEGFPVFFWIEGLGADDAAGAFIVIIGEGKGKLYSSEGKLLSADALNECDFYGEGLCGKKEGDLWGYMDLHTGKMIIPAQYTKIFPFVKGIAQVTTKDNKVNLITNPLKNKGKSTVVASTSLDEKHSDIDDNIPVTRQNRENTFAVIVANQNYEEFSVPYAIGDGKTFEQYCLKTLGIPQSNILYYEDATINILQSATTRITELCEVYEGDASVIFYFSGQGASDPTGNPYLLASDSRTQLLSQTAYPLEHLFSLLGSLNVQSATAFIDAGFDNRLRDGKPMLPEGAPKAKSKVAPTRGKLIAITATTGNETAYAYSEQIHGLFTYYLCQKLKTSKGDVTLSEIVDYLGKQVPKTSMSVFGGSQTPQIQSSISTNIKL